MRRINRQIRALLRIEDYPGATCLLGATRETPLLDDSGGTNIPETVVLITCLQREFRRVSEPGRGVDEGERAGSKLTG